MNVIQSLLQQDTSAAGATESSHGLSVRNRWRQQAGALQTSITRSLARAVPHLSPRRGFPALFTRKTPGSRPGLLAADRFAGWSIGEFIRISRRRVSRHPLLAWLRRKARAQFPSYACCA